MRDDAESVRVDACPVCGSSVLTPLDVRMEYAQQKKDVFRFVFEDCHCDGCGFVFSRLRPSEKYLEAYYAQYLENLSEVSASEIEARLVFLDDVLRPGMKVLEIGGGYGAFSDHLRSRGLDVVHYDLSFGEGQKMTRQGGLDLVCSYYVGEHVSGLNSWIGMQSGLLNDGGYLAIEVPNFRNWPVESMNNEHVNHFSPHSLQAFLERNGFHVLKIDENSEGRYFGMTALARKSAASTDSSAGYEPVTLEKAKAAVRKVMERKEQFADCADWMKSCLAAGKKVAIWPCNELATGVLACLGQAERDCLYLFDKDSRKSGMAWFDCAHPVALPAQQQIMQCDAFCILSPAYAGEIEKDIRAQHSGTPQIRKIAA